MVGTKMDQIYGFAPTLRRRCDLTMLPTYKKSSFDLQLPPNYCPTVSAAPARAYRHLRESFGTAALGVPQKLVRILKSFAYIIIWHLSEEKRD